MVDPENTRQRPLVELGYAVRAHGEGDTQFGYPTSFEIALPRYARTSQPVQTPKFRKRTDSSIEEHEWGHVAGEDADAKHFWWQCDEI